MRTVFRSKSSNDSKFALTPFNTVGQLSARTLQLGGREHRCMRTGRRKVICSATVHCGDTSTSSESPTCCHTSADRGRLDWYIVSQMTGRGRGGVGGNTTWATTGGIGEDGFTFVDSVQQCRFGGREVGVDGAWLSPSATGAYPNSTCLDTCTTTVPPKMVPV